MQGQPPPVQVKEPYGNLQRLSVGSFSKHPGVYRCTPPYNNQKLIVGRKMQTDRQSVSENSEISKSREPEIRRNNPVFFLVKSCQLEVRGFDIKIDF